MDARYLLGCAKVDAHHAILINLLNDLHEKLGTHTVELADLRLAKNSLRNYAIHHFALEESLMARTSYTGIIEHCDQHSKFTHRVAELVLPEDVKSELRDATLEIVLALNTWFIRHIMSDDKKLMDWLRENHPELL